MNETIKIFFRRFNKFSSSMFFIIVFISLFFWTCDNFYFGKSQEDIEKELARDMFVVDSLMRTIELGLDSSMINTDIEPLYIKALRMSPK